ncbi:MAG TPA: pitrilysin family protein [Gemmatimonadaceae bacterium]|nr:pitrilysin family protein [Gemmatimonadaceae bacterium]
MPPPMFPFVLRRALVPMVLLAATARPQSVPVIRPLTYTRVALENGLIALVNEDRSSPLVVVDVWYHIGSKDDKPGRLGTAHLCEHLFNEGSPNLEQSERTFYNSIGGTSPHYANTTEDITHFYIAVPSNQLETVLWAESDRMAAPFARADERRLASVREVIKQEREQNVENVLFGVARELTMKSLFPVGHPYHASPMPPMADVYPATLDDAKASCLPYYIPNNAVLSVSGDVDPAAARALIEKYFGGIPRGKALPRRAAARVTLPAEARVVLEDSRASQPRLQIDWPVVGFSHPDRLALRALASALSINRFGRLSKLLVADRQLASAVSVDYYDLENAGVFEVLVSPRPGASMTTIENVIDSVMAALPSSPLTARELARFNNYNATVAVVSIETRFARADTLAHGEIFAGDPIAYAKQVTAARAVTPADVQAAVKRYLTTGRLVMSLVPAGKLDLVSKPNLPFTNVTPASSLRAKAQP